MTLKYVPQSKHQAVRNKYNNKIVIEVSEKNFDEEIIINHFLHLLNNNKNELIDDLENVKKKRNFAIKIQDSFKGYDLSMFLDVKKNKDGKLKLSVRSKLILEEGKEELIDYIKREITCDIMKGLI